MDPDADHGWAGPRHLRIATVAAFIPAFPLCVAHGVVSHQLVPAIGLVPLALSAAAGIFLCRPSSSNSKLAHPAAIFSGDAILAAGLMVTLVFTWISVGHSHSAGQSMLAAYATMPLLVNFLLHLFFAVRAFYVGLAVHSLVQWVAWRAVPPECPNCHHNLRPPLPAFPWLRGRDPEGYTSLFVNDEESRYRDEVEEIPETPHPAPVNVVGKSRKGKGTAATDEGSDPWES